MSHSNNFRTHETEVLFQKMGQRWYIFAEINNDVVYSVLPEGMDPYSTKLELFDIIEEHMQRVSKINKREVAA
jgi:hypothetical protein